MEKERRIILEEINMARDDPDQRVNNLIDRLLWYGNPLGKDVAGERSSVSAITRDEMLEYMNLSYLPSNTVVAVAGNIEHGDVLEAVTRSLGGWQSRAYVHKFKTYKPKEGPRVKIEKRRIEQAHLCMALPGLSVFHPDRFPLDLISIILGEGMSSRLFAEVRDNLGLAYTISSYTEHMADTGSVVIYAGVDSAKLSTAVSAVAGQLALFKNEEVSDAELTKAKEMSKGRILLRMEDSRSVASWMGSQEILTGKILTIEDILAAIDAITASGIRRVASEIMLSDRLKLAVVGPSDKKESLEPLLSL